MPETTTPTERPFPKAFLLRAPRDLMDRLALLAEREHRSTNSQIVHLLSRALESLAA